MKKSTKLLLAIVLLTGNWRLETENSFAQDIHFSQFYNSPLTLNPALAGSFNGDIRLQANYKAQWTGIPNAYKTFAAAYDMGILKDSKKGFLGLGLSMFNDKAGDSKMGITQAALSVSGNISLNGNNNLSGGLQGCFSQRSLSYSDLKWDNQYVNGGYSASQASGEIMASDEYSYGDFSAGLNWNYGKGNADSRSNDAIKINAGAAVYHINQPEQLFYDISNEKLYSKIALHAGSVIGIKNSSISIVPNFLFLKQGNTQEITVGTAIKHRVKETPNSKTTSTIALGGHYRLGDAMIINAQVEFSDYALGISYDLNTSALKNATAGNGGVEFALRYIGTFSNKSKKSNSRF